MRTIQSKIQYLKLIREVLFDLAGENTNPDATSKIERARKSIQELLDYYLEYNK